MNTIPRKIIQRMRAWGMRRMTALRCVKCRTGACLAGTKLTTPPQGLGTPWVPLNINGQGSVTLGDSNTWGCNDAVKLGDGAILIQARTPKSAITIGARNRVSNNVAIVSTMEISIGDGCQIGDMVTIYDCDFHEVHPATRKRTHGESAPVRIGSNVWLGSRVMVLKGVQIGDNSVIAAMSVVTRDVPINCLAAGIPARIIRRLAVEATMPTQPETRP